MSSISKPAHQSTSVEFPVPQGPPPRSNPQSHTSMEQRVYGFDLNENWQGDNDHYDNQKINGLTFPRTIRSSAFTQKLDIEECDPLALPFSALLYQQANNLAAEAWYLIPTGDISRQWNCYLSCGIAESTMTGSPKFGRGPTAKPWKRFQSRGMRHNW